MMGAFAHMYYHSFIRGREIRVTVDDLMDLAIQGLSTANLQVLHHRLGMHLGAIGE